jgi:hypothetical protein
MDMDGWKVSLVMAISLMLAGCTGDGSGQVAGIDRGGAVGPITGFGSVIVNGLHYETGSALISVNGLPATEADLEVGYYVSIEADFPEGGAGPNATSIQFNHNVIGPLSNVDIQQSQAMVLGQLITVNDSTAFDSSISPASIEGLALLPVGQILRVSGFVDAAGSILTTRVGLGAAESVVEVVGVVENLDTAAQRFEIGNLLVDYQFASIEGFPAGTPSEGDRVEVGGSAFGPGGELIASEVQNSPEELEFEDGDAFEIEGLITDFVSSTNFSVAGVPVTTDSQTQFENGDAADLALDIKVEVEGRFNSSGLLIADEVEFKPEGEIQVEALTESVDTGKESLVVLGILFQITSSTSFEDKSPQELRPFSLEDVNPGDPLRVVGTESADVPGTVIASRVERTEPLEKLSIKGIAENVVEPDFEILGVTIMTDGNTDLEDTFFATAQGRLVEAEGNVVGGVFLAEKVEIKD